MTKIISIARQVSEVHEQLAASTIDTFLARGRKSFAGEAERSNKRGSGAAAPSYDKRNQQRSRQQALRNLDHEALTGLLD